VLRRRREEAAAAVGGWTCLLPWRGRRRGEGVSLGFADLGSEQSREGGRAFWIGGRVATGSSLLGQTEPGAVDRAVWW
jgi:hypothetical protein